jgi:hypothetical protein
MSTAAYFKTPIWIKLRVFSCGLSCSPEAGHRYLSNSTAFGSIGDQVMLSVIVVR